MTPTNARELPPGFISPEDAVKLIQSDTRQNPVVDMDYLVGHINWIEVGKNIRIPRIRRLGADEIYRTRRGKYVEYENVGSANVAIDTAFQRELLRKTILDKYQELTSKEFREVIVRATSTVADDAQGKEAVRPRVNKPIMREGQSIGGGEVVTSNGEGITV